MTEAADAPAATFAEETPLYEVVERTFIAPWMIEPGSVIRFKGSPGAHLKPLNASAVAAMEAWYNLGSEIPDQFDPRKTVTVYPNLHHKNVHLDQTAADAGGFELVAEPTAPTQIAPSLTEARANRSAGLAPDRSQRPPPAATPTRDYLDQMEVVSAATPKRATR